MNTPSPHGHTIFCDDIRQEVGGKITYVGCYYGQINVFGIVPIGLPKLCLATHLIEPLLDERINQKREARIEVTVTSEDYDGVVAQNVISTERFNAPKTEGISEEDRVIATVTPFILSPFVIRKDCRLKVRAYRGDEIFKLGSLMIKVHPAPSETET